jgi:hypothetical protein
MQTKIIRSRFNHDVGGTMQGCTIIQKPSTRQLQAGLANLCYVACLNAFRTPKALLKSVDNSSC